MCKPTTIRSRRTIMPPASRSKGGAEMCPHLKTAVTVAERYDQALMYARDKFLSADAPHPKPTQCWPKENIDLLERFQAWLMQGGACKYSTDFIYMPIAGHALGLNLK